MDYMCDSQEKVGALEAQVKQLGFQAAQDCERLTKDKTVTLQLLHKVSTQIHEQVHDGDVWCEKMSMLVFRSKRDCAHLRRSIRL